MGVKEAVTAVSEPWPQRRAQQWHRSCLASFQRALPLRLAYGPEGVGTGRKEEERGTCVARQTQGHLGHFASFFKLSQGHHYLLPSFRRQDQRG